MSEYYDGGIDEAAAADCCCGPEEATAEQSWDDPALTDASVGAPVSTEPVSTEPVYEAPVYTEPVYEEPVYEAPAPAYEPAGYEAPAPAYEPAVYEAPAVTLGGDTAVVGPSDAALFAGIPAAAPVAGTEMVVGPSDALAGLYPTTAVVGGDGGPDFTIVGPSDAGLYPTSGVVGGNGDPGFSVGGPDAGLYPTSMAVGGAPQPDGVFALLNTMSEFTGRSYQEQQAALAALAASGIEPGADPSTVQRLLREWFKGIRSVEDTMSPGYNYGDDQDPTSRFYRDRA